MKKLLKTLFKLFLLPTVNELLRRYLQNRRRQGEQ